MRWHQNSDLLRLPDALSGGRSEHSVTSVSGVTLSFSSKKSADLMMRRRIESG